LQEYGVGKLEDLGADGGQAVISVCEVAVTEIDTEFFGGILQSQLLSGKPITIQLEDKVVPTTRLRAHAHGGFAYM
jgi:hypothetical protein